MLFYCQNLSTVFSQVSQTVKAALPGTATFTLQSFIPGDWILLREFRREHRTSRRWTGPYEILLDTQESCRKAPASSGTQVIFQLDHPRPERCEDSGPPPDKEL
ncbi:hypothetical protein AMECASPLE_038994 [Ameca splendens]|uniref:Murine leukemia virus integrase C-terminal domain-containing protein n=1 Tax=Ameca splendens TaxID=208324 RepID=A0ABV0Z682_9TELE